MKIWHGGEVYYELEHPNILFAKDGEIYDFDGKKEIAIGDAYSRDKEYRLLTGLPWFQDEQPDGKVKSQVENRLNEVDWKVDYVFSHTCPLVYRPNRRNEECQEKIDLSTEEWMDEIVKIEREDKCIFILQVIHIGALIVLKIFAMDMKPQQRM